MRAAAIAETGCGPDALAGAPVAQSATRPERKRSGRGIAYVHYKHTDNRLGLGIEVGVNRGSGAVRVTRAVCVYEAGLMINPDAVRAQVEGNILQAISRTLHEEVLFDETGVTSTDWASYPISHFPRSAGTRNRPDRIGTRQATRSRRSGIRTRSRRHRQRNIRRDGPPDAESSPHRRPRARRTERPPRNLTLAAGPSELKKSLRGSFGSRWTVGRGDFTLPARPLRNMPDHPRPAKQPATAGMRSFGGVKPGIYDLHAA